MARVARARGVNANLVFNWCRLYRAGRLGVRQQAKLLPVRVAGESTALPVSLHESSSLPNCSGTIHLQLPHAEVRVEGSADPMLLEGIDWRRPLRTWDPQLSV